MVGSVRGTSDARGCFRDCWEGSGTPVAHDAAHDARALVCFRDCCEVWQLMLMMLGVVWENRADADDARGCLRDCWEMSQLRFVLERRAADVHDDGRVCLCNAGQLMLMMLWLVFEMVAKSGR